MTEKSADRSSHTSTATEGGATHPGQPSMENKTNKQKKLAAIRKKSLMHCLQDSAQLVPGQGVARHAMTANVDPLRTLEPCLQRVVKSTL